MIEWKRVACFNDEHRPYHYEPAVELTLKILEAFDPQILVVGSDGLDFHSLSGFVTDPRFMGGLYSEKKSFWEGIREKKDACPNSQMVYITGNHEDRYLHYLYNCPEFLSDPSYSLWNWLNLDDLGIHYELEEVLEGVPGIDPVQRIRKRIEITPNFTVMHGEFVRKHSGRSAQAQLLDGERMQTSLLMGHCHRGGKYETSDRKGEAIGAYEGYHHQRLDMPWLKGKNPDWQWGTVLVEVMSEPPYHFSVEQINYITGYGKFSLRARWRGKEFRVR